MRASLRAILLLLAAGLIAGGALWAQAARSQNTPAAAVEALNQALIRRDLPAVQALATPEFRAESFHNPGWLYEEATEGGPDLTMVFTPVRTLERGDRAALIAQGAITDGRPADDVVFYLVRAPEGWRFAGVDEQEGRIPLFLHALTDVEGDSGDCELNPPVCALGEALLAGKPALVGPDAAAVEREIARLRQPRIRETRWDRPSGWAAFGLEDETGEYLWIYARSTEAGWEALGWLYPHSSPRPSQIPK